MPYQLPPADAANAVGSLTSPAVAVEHWRHRLPTLGGSAIELRELQKSDAAALLAAMSGPDVTRFLSPPPTSIEGFEKFVAWSHRQRTAGQCLCFVVTLRGTDTAIGVFQLRSLDADFGTSEWGCALAQEYWCSGLFIEAARLFIEFAFNVVGAHRLEARAALRNGRGNGALRKIGAVQEGVLRRSFLRNGEYLDQALWTILSDEWMQAKAVWGPRITH
jgi:RimJ/RimL family protein N-acetyltransferase